MVAGEVGEECACETESGYAVLVCGVRAHLHEGVGAADIHHARQQLVQRYGVGRGVGGGDRLILYVVAHGGEKSGAVALQACHLIEKGGAGGLAVGACHAHKAQFLRRMVVPCRRQLAQRHGTVGDPDVGHSQGAGGGQLLAHYGAHVGTLDHGYIFMSVCERSFHRHEHAVLVGKPRVGAESGYVAVGVTYNLQHFSLLEQLPKFLHLPSISLLVNMFVCCAPPLPVCRAGRRHDVALYPGNCPGKLLIVSKLIKFSVPA